MNSCKPWRYRLHSVAWVLVRSAVRRTSGNASRQMLDSLSALILLPIPHEGFRRTLRRNPAAS